MSEVEPSALFRAFADPTRLRILHLLHEAKEVCVCDLCDALDEIQPKVSRHLAHLRRVGLVEVREAGRWKYYALARGGTRLHRRLLACVGACLADFPELAADRARLAALGERSPCG
jgi:ArsR family transcriptional regulator